MRCSHLLCVRHTRPSSVLVNPHILSAYAHSCHPTGNGTTGYMGPGLAGCTVRPRHRSCPGLPVDGGPAANDAHVYSLYAAFFHLS